MTAGLGGRLIAAGWLTAAPVELTMSIQRAILGFYGRHLTRPFLLESADSVDLALDDLLLQDLEWKTEE